MRSTRLDGSSDELAAAERVGYVQGHHASQLRLLAEAALDRRVPRLWAKGLVDQFGRMDPAVAAKGLANPLGQLDEAVGRARANAVWSKGLTGEDGTRMRDALIERFTVQIGNSWGMEAEDSDKANRLALQRAQSHAEQLRSSQRTTRDQRNFIDRVDRIAAGLREVDEAAQQAGLPRPQLVAFDPTELGGGGHAVISFGGPEVRPGVADPYRAEKVSWKFAEESIDQLAASLVRPAIDQTQSEQRETPSAVTMVWLGKNPRQYPWSASRNDAEHAFHCDQAAFQAAAEARADNAESSAVPDIMAEIVGDVQRHADLRSSELVKSALNKRVPRVRPEDLVTPLGSAERATERARANAIWWPRLLEVQKQALIEAYPYQIGNSGEGIPPYDRHRANEIVRQHVERLADRLRSEHSNGRAATAPERKFLGQVAQIDVWLRYAGVAAEEAGMGPLQLHAFDPLAFGGDGLIVIGVGADADEAENVTWHIERQPIGQLGEILIGPALDQTPLDQRVARSGAAIFWIGNNAGRPWSSARNAFYTYHAAFHAARHAQPGTAKPFTRNSIHLLRPPSITVTDPGRTNALWVPRDSGLVVAHRGDSYNYPEQTWAAAVSALDAGADAIECDVHLTKDGHLVVIHDRLVDRTSDGTGQVAGMTFQELQELDFGGWHPSRDLGDARATPGCSPWSRCWN